MKKLIWKFVDKFPNLDIFTELGKIIADYAKKHRKKLKLFCKNVVVARI